MPIVDLDLLRQRYLDERPQYQALADEVRRQLSVAAQQRGLICEVTARAKDVTSFLKKAMRKNYGTPLDDIHDKAGVRVVAMYESSITDIERLVRERFVVHHYEDKRATLSPDKLDYLGVHFEVALRGDDGGSEDQTSNPQLCEIQVHTRAQNLWATVSHDLIYKPPQEPPRAAMRSIYRLIALLELFDGEAERARNEILHAPGYEVAQMLETLERHFYALTTRDSDPELSRHIIATLQPLLRGQSATSYEAVVARFVDENREKLTEIVAAYADDDRTLLLSQPECLLIFQQLSVDPFQLAELWVQHLPTKLLRSLADIWGVPVDV